MTLLRVAFQTLGCKLNQLETESVADRFLATGAKIVPFHEEADLYVVNTCTVTSKAEQKARHDIRAALAKVPHAVVVATGCYAQMEPGALAALGERVIVIPGDLKASLLALAEWLSENWQGHGELLHAVQEWQEEIQSAADAAAAGTPLAAGTSLGALPTDRFAFNPERFAMHSRPALKIQDGCNNRCAYCRVCLARGPSVSLPAQEALARVRKLEQAGKSEVVLTGVNLAQYRDNALGLDFSALLAFLIQGTEHINFRISSYEPERIDDAFLAVFANTRVRPHMHLSVQSGCTETLRRMARPYSAERVRRAVLDLRASRHDPFLAADIIAGFPGETDAEFEQTFSLLAELDFAWIHAFPFSPRPGTRAADMKPRIPERIAGERIARLIALAHSGKQSYIERWIGREVEMVVEHEGFGQDDAKQFDQALTRHSADTHRGLSKVGQPEADSSSVIAALSNVRIIGTTENYLKAEAVQKGSGRQSGIPADAFKTDRKALEVLGLRPGDTVRILIQNVLADHNAEVAAFFVNT
ncbi:MAG: tRNA (N(6)-L-threonylcarbamoyladenosine(37)-C(2))-methylthiotransferase MtaB [Rectinema subterraneum]|uniref:tRNA (N(6)-L-threonylcarbamoyladenosine(37)-C(2))- methylthiotransferase MtaB n=1 Tax=Rectinema subterraneum TaxID=2653714 RepID=UPI003C7C49E5